MKLEIVKYGSENVVVKSWKEVKEHLEKTNLPHCFVLFETKGYNCSLTKTGKLRKD